MIAVLLAIRSGLSLNRLGRLSKRSVAAIKLLIALLLLFIGAVMVVEELHGLL